MDFIIFIFIEYCFFNGIFPGNKKNVCFFITNFKLLPTTNASIKFNRALDNECLTKLHEYYFKPLIERKELVTLLASIEKFKIKLFELTNCNFSIFDNIEIMVKNMMISLNNTKLTESFTVGQAIDKILTKSIVTSKQIFNLLK
jgi:hypothetical protein